MYYKTTHKITFTLFVLVFSMLVANGYQHCLKDKPCSLSGSIIQFIEANFGASFDRLSVISFEYNNKTIKNALSDLLTTSRAERSKHGNKGLYSLAKLVDPGIDMDNLIEKVGNKFVAIASSSNTVNWPKYLQLMSKSKTNSAILAFTGTLHKDNIGQLKRLLDQFSISSMFYVVYMANESLPTFSWFRVITLNSSNQSAVNPLKMDLKGKVIEGYNLQGMHIKSSALSWEPYLSITNCTDTGQNCNSKGYLADVMDILGVMMNFTWESHAQKEKDWGIEPISGPPNASGIWGGVIGEVFNGTYPLSVR